MLKQFIWFSTKSIVKMSSKPVPLQGDQFDPCKLKIQRLNIVRSQLFIGSFQTSLKNIPYSFTHFWADILLSKSPLDV